MKIAILHVFRIRSKYSLKRINCTCFQTFRHDLISIPHTKRVAIIIIFI